MGVILGLDYGTSRIGIAISDPTATIASAIGCHREGVDGAILSYLLKIIHERGVDTLVVGLPLTADGREGEIARRARLFAERLEAEFKLPLFLVDERYSSQEADRWLRISGRKKRAKGERDAVAAELILQQYLDSQSASTGHQEGDS